MQGGHIHADEVINLVSDELLDEIAHQTGVDYSVQKLHGKTLFKLFLFSLLQQGNVSLRVLEAIFSSKKFQTLFGIKDVSVKHSALGMRLQNINSLYFERIFTSLLQNPKLKDVCFEKTKIQTHKIDSTFVGIAEKLLLHGLRNGRSEGRRHLKYTMALSGSIPVNIALCKDQSSISEDVALPPVVKNIPKSTKAMTHIAIFDQGIHKKQTFIDLMRENIFFVSRAEKHTFTVVESLLTQEEETPTLTILADDMVQFSKKKTGTRRITLPEKFRLVTGKNKKTGRIFHFITNIRFLSAAEITELYKSRWEIETFFKFIKQELGFTHMVSRTENGIRSVMYLTMIAAILLTLYKKMNKITGWKVAKIQFLDELEFSIHKEWHEEIGVFLERQQPFAQADPVV